MKEPEFQYGPVSHGILIALLWGTLIPGFLAKEYPSLIFIYILFLLFVVFGLRPLLVKTGIYRRYCEVRHRMGEVRWRPHTRRRRAEVDKAKRDAPHKQRRYKHDDLPRHW